jgi:hypothetical protein
MDTFISVFCVLPYVCYSNGCKVYIPPVSVRLAECCCLLGFLISYHFSALVSMYLCTKCCQCIRRKIVCKLNKVNVLAKEVNIILSLSIIQVSRGKNRILKCTIIMFNLTKLICSYNRKLVAPSKYVCW